MLLIMIAIWAYILPRPLILPMALTLIWLWNRSRKDET
jgi:hypothetical protein